MDLLYRPAPPNHAEWATLTPAQRRTSAIAAREKEVCGTTAPCSAEQTRRLTDEVDDVDGSRRVLLAIRAGHDMVLQFRLPDPQPDQLRRTVDVVVDAVAQGAIPRSQIDASVLRILALKDRIFGPALYEAFPDVHTPEALLARLSLRDKVMQMIAVDGRFQRERVERLGLGALYLPNADADPHATAVPMLFLGDAMHGDRRIWRARFAP